MVCNQKGFKALNSLATHLLSHFNIHGVRFKPLELNVFGCTVNIRGREQPSSAMSLA